MSYVYSFEKLQVWKDAKELVKNLYQLTNTFPDSEKYGLCSQLRRAGISIVSNIAEGSGRISHKEQSHFYQIAFSSLIEMINQLIVAGDLGFLSAAKLESIRPQIEKVSNKLNSLRNSCFK